VAICFASAFSLDLSTETAIAAPVPPALIPATAAEIAELASMRPLCARGR
jgi:hypothetical protein